MTTLSKTPVTIAATQPNRETGAGDQPLPVVVDGR